MGSQPGGFRLRVRHFGSAALCAVVVFALICTAAQWLRGDLDWMRAPLSFYLLGDYGWAVKGAYFGLAIALVLLGLGYYRALGNSARSGAPLLLFVTGGMALAVTAAAESGPGPAANSLEAVVHVVSAGTAFLCVTVAMLLQSVRLRYDEAWRERFALAFWLGATSFVAMWVHVLWREAPRGLTQKIVIALIVAWLSLAAWWLHRHRDMSAQRQPERINDDT